MFKISLFSISIMSALFLASTARAYYQNPNLYPLGEKEAYMANTGVALTGSTGAVLYNPAGLATIGSSKVSMSANSYLSIKTKYAPLENVDNTDLNLSTEGVIAVPSSLVSVEKYEDWVLAFSVLVPEVTQLNSMSNGETTNYNTQLTLETKSQLLLVGLTGAKKREDGYDYGFGCFITMFNGDSNQSVVATPKPGAPGAVTTGVSTSSATVNVQGILCNAGVQKDFDKNLRWGVSTRLPFVKLSGKAKAFSFVQTTGGAIANSGIQDLDIDYQIPLEVSGGLAYKLLENTEIYFDSSYQFPMDYKPNSASVSSTESKGTLRYSLGAAVNYSKMFRFYGGLAKNPATNVLKSAGDVAEDFTVLTIGTEWVQKITTTGVGILVANTTGESLLSNGRKGGVSTDVFGILISAGFSF